MRKIPRVFVACSREALRFAEAIQQNLVSADVTVWNQDAFRVGNALIDELSRNLQMSDFGIIVFAPDDIVTIHGVEQYTVRDNVLFELGMFIGRLGKERSFIVRPKSNIRIPTDLWGVITATYDYERAENEPAAAFGVACAQIKDAIKRQHFSRTTELNFIMKEALETICRSMAAPLTPGQAGLRAFIFRKEEDELVCRYFWDPHESAEEVGVTRFKIDEKTAEEVVVVKCVLANALRSTTIDETRGASVTPLSHKIRMEGRIKSDIQYVLSAPIRNADGSIWGVVDFDASKLTGVKRLANKKTANPVILQLARGLAKILAH